MLTQEFINEDDYYANKEKELNKCIEFLKENNSEETFRI